MFPNDEFVKKNKKQKTKKTHTKKTQNRTKKNQPELVTAILHCVLLNWQTESAGLCCFGPWYASLIMVFFAFLTVSNSCALSFLACFLPVG